MSFTFKNISLQGMVFDMDGVLVDTSECHSKAFDSLWKSLGIIGPEYSIIAGRSTIEVIQEYTDLDENLLKEAVRNKQKSAIKLIATTDISFLDTEESIKKLYESEIPMAVATSASKEGATLSLKNGKIFDYFKKIVTASDEKRAKPAPDIFLNAIQSMGFLPEECLVIEDSVSGVEAGLAAGAKVVSVRNSEILIHHFSSHKNFLGHHVNLSDLVGNVQIH